MQKNTRLRVANIVANKAHTSREISKKISAILTSMKTNGVQDTEKPIVLYDDKCNFCIASKNLAEKNSDNTYKFLSIHSGEGKSISDKHQLKTEDSMYVVSGEVIEEKSDAALSILRNMKWWGRILAKIGELFPKRFSDSIYDIVAKHRK